ncbi:hypothetical protein [Devosia ginsengisoli]|uniref:Uncharacterized protein n=1 Tax=Devosia ginsengisoli TaxID=400770 RepID=A0A5B8LR40_9HYPH|nr:hypothetical protein [Devosia ginsengisoli]QDZ10556.1 hypothetical protein FPZ08_07200 [Devosia ginsengisoli]
MSRRDNGGHAFPPALVKHPHSGTITGASGMTRREWLAGLAMQAMLTGAFSKNNPLEAADLTSICAGAYRFADAMIAEGSK